MVGVVLIFGMVHEIFLIGVNVHLIYMVDMKMVLIDMVVMIHMAVIHMAVVIHMTVVIPFVLLLPPPLLLHLAVFPLYSFVSLWCFSPNSTV